MTIAPTAWPVRLANGEWPTETIVAKELRGSEYCRCGAVAATLLLHREVVAMGNDRTVSRRPDGSWANKKDGATKAGSLHDTQADAIAAAREMLENTGGVELKVKGVDGKIRSKDTIPPGNDPNPPKDREH